jgi:hypothetical protein
MVILDARSRGRILSHARLAFGRTPGEAFFATLPAIKFAACPPRTFHLKISEDYPNE